MSFKILFLVRFSHTSFLLGQHTLHNLHLLLTAIRVTDYNMMYVGPNLTRGGPKMGGGAYFHMTLEYPRQVVGTDLFEIDGTH